MFGLVKQSQVVKVEGKLAKEREGGDGQVNR